MRALIQMNYPLYGSQALVVALEPVSRLGNRADARASGIAAGASAHAG